MTMPARWRTSKIRYLFMYQVSSSRVIAPRVGLTSSTMARIVSSLPWLPLHTIVASTLTSKEVDDAAELGALLAQVDDPLAAVIADGAYDQDNVYDTVAEHSAEAMVVVPPRATAVLSTSAETDPTQRDRHIQAIAERGRMGWQRTSGYNARAGAEGAMSRYKRIIGDTLRSHTRPAQEVETRIAVNVLNRMLDLARPDSVRAA
jgi:hypothetical protein